MRGSINKQVADINRIAFIVRFVPFEVRSSNMKERIQILWALHQDKGDFGKFDRVLHYYQVCTKTIRDAKLPNYNPHTDYREIDCISKLERVEEFYRRRL